MMQLSENTPISLVIQGLGSAGRSRLKACEALEKVQLGGILSRRAGLGTLDLDPALWDPKLNAWAVSLENAQHPQAVRTALEAGKHVLCDYPLCFSKSEGRDLFRLAKDQGRILHVEHIGLLSEDHQSLKVKAKRLGPPLKGDYLFQGGWSEKLLDPRRMGPLPFLCLSRFMQVADLFGPFEIGEPKLEMGGRGFSLHFHLQFPNGGVLGFSEERKEGLPRHRSLLAQCEGGPLNWKAGLGAPGLFLKDLECFVGRIRGHADCYYDEALMLRLLGQLEMAAKKLKQP